MRLRRIGEFWIFMLLVDAAVITTIRMTMAMSVVATMIMESILTTTVVVITMTVRKAIPTTRKVTAITWKIIHMIIMDITMQMKFLQAGERRRRIVIQKGN